MSVVSCELCVVSALAYLQFERGPEGPELEG